MLGNGCKPVMLAAAGAIQAGDIGDVVLLNARKSYKWGMRPTGSAIAKLTAQPSAGLPSTRWK